MTQVAQMMSMLMVHQAHDTDRQKQEAEAKLEQQCKESNDRTRNWGLDE